MTRAQNRQFTDRVDRWYSRFDGITDDDVLAVLLGQETTGESG
jgi:predicted phosphoribosyltransferase